MHTTRLSFKTGINSIGSLILHPPPPLPVCRPLKTHNISTELTLCKCKPKSLMAQDSCGHISVCFGKTGVDVDVSYWSLKKTSLKLTYHQKSLLPWWHDQFSDCFIHLHILTSEHIDCKWAYRISNRYVCRWQLEVKAAFSDGTLMSNISVCRYQVIFDVQFKQKKDQICGQYKKILLVGVISTTENRCATEVWMTVPKAF